MIFRRGEGFDQFGRAQVANPGIRSGSGTWEHRVIGLCSSAPSGGGRHGIVFTGGKPGNHTVYIDNLRIRHADGSTTPIWENGKDTRFRSIADSNLFTHISVRAVPCSDASK